MNGSLLPWRETKVHVLNHGLHYASCVLEGERVYGGHVFKLQEHTERLIQSARELGFEVPYSAARLNDATYELIEDNKIKDGYVRPLAWRGSEAMAIAAKHTKTHVLLAAWELPDYFDPASRLRGIRMSIARWVRGTPNSSPVKAKATCHYTIGTMSRNAAEAEGYDDALMLDYRGHIAEASGANFFMVKDGALHTPIPDCFLNGITRQTVIDLARDRGLEVVERFISPEELSSADEVFLTGTAAEVTPVREIGPYSFQVGPVTRALMEDYHLLVRSPSRAAPMSGVREIGSELVGVESQHCPPTLDSGEERGGAGQELLGIEARRRDLGRVEPRVASA